MKNIQKDDAWFSEGNNLYKANHFDEAIRCYNQALQIDPGNASTNNYKGLCLSNLGRVGEAITYYAKALQINPKYLTAWCNLGINLEVLDRYEEALQCFTRVLKFDPQNVLALNHKNSCESKLSRSKNLVNPDREKANQLPATETGSENSNDWYKKGEELFGKGKYEEAILCFDKALEVDPCNSSAWNKKGNCLNNLHRLEDALLCYDRALHLNTKNASVWNNKGLATNNLGRHKEAITCYDKALEIDSNHIIAWCNRGFSFQALSLHQEALQCFKKALEINPQFKTALQNKAFSESILKRSKNLVVSNEIGISHDSRPIKKTQKKAIAKSVRMSEIKRPEAPKHLPTITKVAKEKTNYRPSPEKEKITQSTQDKIIRPSQKEREPQEQNSRQAAAAQANALRETEKQAEAGTPYTSKVAVLVMRDGQEVTKEQLVRAGAVLAWRGNTFMELKKISQLNVDEWFTICKRMKLTLALNDGRFDVETGEPVIGTGAQAQANARRETEDKVRLEAQQKADLKARLEFEESKHLELTLELAPGVSMEFVRVPAGEFWMGSDPVKDKPTNPNEVPRHKVSLNEYLIGKTPVTNQQYGAFVQASGYHIPGRWKDRNIPEGIEKHPVIWVSWDDAQAFCAWASQVSGTKVRLPSEAEWEKAARGADGRRYPWGDQDPDATRCNFKGNVNNTTPVGRYSPKGDSPCGCVDMAGNVWEWVNDWYDVNYYAYSPTSNPQGPASGQCRVLRGGEWGLTVDWVHSAKRHCCASANALNYYGFRCAHSLSSKASQVQTVNPVTNYWYQGYSTEASSNTYNNSINLPIETKVVGVTYEGRQSVVAILKVGEEVLLVREPENPYDCNAIKVYRKDGRDFGFLSRQLAIRLAPEFDKHKQPVKATVISITGGHYSSSNLGVTIKFNMPE